MKTTTVYKPSFPILGALGLIFITLKLCAVIQWSWWWVLAPFWVPVGVAVVFLCIMAALAVIINLTESK